MGTNCYDLNLGIEVCIDGEVPPAPGSTNGVRVFVNDSLVTSAGQIIDLSTWDGTPLQRNLPIDFSLGCDVLESTVTIEPEGVNQIRVTVTIVFDNCDDFTTLYASCGENPGPHTFTESQVLPLGEGACSDGAIL